MKVTDKVKFKVGNSQYVIGTGMFPVAQKSKLEFFNIQNTKAVEDEKIIAMLDSKRYHGGRCYSNADDVYEMLLGAGYDVEYFAGWIFFSPNYTPVHHAWVVLDGEKVIDVSMNIITDEILRKVDTSKPDWREMVAPDIRRIENNPRYKTSMTAVVGIPPLQYIYVGCPDECENAKRIFRGLAEKFPNHPTYKHAGRNMNGASDLQKMLYEDMR